MDTISNDKIILNLSYSYSAPTFKLLKFLRARVRIPRHLHTLRDVFMF